MVTTAAGTTEHREPRDKVGKAEIVIVDLDKVQTSRDVRLLRKGRGKLARRVEELGRRDNAVDHAPGAELFRRITVACHDNLFGPRRTDHTEESCR